MITSRKKSYSPVKIALLAACLMLVSLSLASRASAAEAGSAKTPPPPPEFSTMGAFDPGHTYLDDGYTIANNLGDGKLEITSITRGKSAVDLLGTRITLQVWTGSIWSNYYISSSLTDTNASTLVATFTRTVDTGYYYRVVSTHWANTEQGVLTGNSFLVN